MREQVERTGDRAGPIHTDQGRAPSRTGRHWQRYPVESPPSPSPTTGLGAGPVPGPAPPISRQIMQVRPPTRIDPLPDSRTMSTWRAASDGLLILFQDRFP